MFWINFKFLTLGFYYFNSGLCFFGLAQGNLTQIFEKPVQPVFYYFLLLIKLLFFSISGTKGVLTHSRSIYC